MAERMAPALERELAAARQRGRWLSDDEHDALELARQQNKRKRQRLLLLLAVCIVLPPFWPLALGITAYLLFPRTTVRLGVVALVLGLLVVVGMVMLLVALMHWL